MAAGAQRVDIGFQGGQVLAVRLESDSYDGLRKALADERSERWYDLKSEDSEISLDLSQVVYVRLDTDEHRIGF
jgi:hypothetical protein